ncbi:hypothetical protein DMN91_008659 [Ooceraea biroi]|uniref:Uncharacterized protein n=1 Tax=Ooceraea biroi TaxID=2015173 RepID=A0A3L8DDS7_OOCBI|nr:hypothetical protein DMN91_008659 [Ooceraea biroi]
MNLICRTIVYYFLAIYLKGLLQSLKLYSGHPPDLVKCTADFDFPADGEGSGDYDINLLDGSGDIDLNEIGRDADEDKSEESNPPPFITPPPPNPDCE